MKQRRWCKAAEIKIATVMSLTPLGRPPRRRRRARRRADAGLQGLYREADGDAERRGRRTDFRAGYRDPGAGGRACRVQHPRPGRQAYRCGPASPSRPWIRHAELAMSGTASIGDGILVEAPGRRIGSWLAHTGAQGVSQSPGRSSIPIRSQSTGQSGLKILPTLATIEQQIQKDGQAAQERRQRGLPPTYQICVELPVTLGLTSGRKRAAFSPGTGKRNPAPCRRERHRAETLEAGSAPSAN